MLASSICRQWNFLAPGSPNHGVRWIVELFCAHCSRTLWWSSNGWLPTGGGGLQALLSTGPLDKAEACPRVSVPPITSSGRQRGVDLWRGPNLLLQDVCQSSLEHGTVLYWMIVRSDYTSAPGSMVGFFSAMFGNKAALGIGLCPSEISVVI